MPLLYGIWIAEQGKKLTQSKGIVPLFRGLHRSSTGFEAQTQIKEHSDETLPIRIFGIVDRMVGRDSRGIHIRTYK